ncbi:S41 family peptidase [Flaviaesturariibacter aridisoli]|uniref:S41 family peptidase n=1 Tax=Flaviaesturariibacter aridisoli TaxID=2545761 RepID=A0A4R4DVZ6_9BACT|nr:S41 family peptidase [Flaviaesturariibacter aridisoli]TCZ68098.1 S41 family peptidase [Flaviaesturariibacter aridisoli]
MRNKKLQVWLPLLFSLVMISGMFFGFRLHQQTGTGKGFFAREGRSSLQEAIDLIRSKYVDKVRIDSLQDNAMEGLMNQLDPHSVYIPNREVSEANEDIAGNFEGIGVEFNIFSDTVNVLYVVPGGPGEKAGLQIGDRIIQVNDANIVSKTLPSDSIRRMIRGPGGTQVKLSIVRKNTTQYFYVTRGTIPLPSLDAAYMLDGANGYIRLNKFSETTYREFMRAMEDLQAKGMKALVLDLRGNGGGLVTQAVNIADEFIGGNELIVYTQGTNSQRHDYNATKDGVFEKGKLVVLVDELTASASEILAGALQDLDRATIVGRRSFGKGLVQEQYGLSDGSAIRLTVARYFTPLGRSIQRPYDKGKKVYLEEVLERYRNGEVIHPDSVYHATGQAYKTKAGRTVYGGGGIMPDVYVPVDTSSLTANISKLYLDGKFNNYVYLYYMSHRNDVNAFKAPADFARGFVNTDAAWQGLVDFAEKDSVNLRNIPEKDKREVQARIRAYLARLRWRTQGFYEVYNQTDPVVLRAQQVVKS